MFTGTNYYLSKTHVTPKGNGGRFAAFSFHSHNSWLLIKVGERLSLVALALHWGVTDK